MNCPGQCTFFLFSKVHVNSSTFYTENVTKFSLSKLSGLIVRDVYMIHARKFKKNLYFLYMHVQKTYYIHMYRKLTIYTCIETYYIHVRMQRKIQVQKFQCCHFWRKAKQHVWNFGFIPCWATSCAVCSMSTILFTGEIGTARVFRSIVNFILGRSIFSGLSCIHLRTLNAKTQLLLPSTMQFNPLIVCQCFH